MSGKQDIFLEKCFKIHGEKYLYHNTIYVKALEKVSITCRIHGDFLQRPSSHLQGHGCSHCHYKSAGGTTGFIIDATAVHATTYNYDKVDYAGRHTKVVIYCYKHGDFEQTPAAHIRLKQGCKKCAFEKIPDRHLGAAKDFIDKATAVHGDRYDYSKTEYVRSRFKVEIICKEHGSFWQTPNAHLSGHDCVECSAGGFDSKRSGYVYVLSDGVTSKVGITNKTPRHRTKEINQLSGKDFKTVAAFLFESGTDARNVEREMLSYLKDVGEPVSEKFNGYTECFNGVDLTHLLINLVSTSIKCDILTFKSGCL